MRRVNDFTNTDREEERNNKRRRIEERATNSRNKIIASLTEEITREKIVFIHDSEHLIQAIEAIIATNSEISQRVMKAAVPEMPFDYCFEKVKYGKIRVRAMKDKIYFHANPGRERRKFDPKPKILPLLDELLRYDESSSDESYLERAIGIFNEEVLIHFLALFKKYIEDCTVYFGEIESWVTQSSQDDMKCLNNFFERSKRGYPEISAEEIDVEELADEVDSSYIYIRCFRRQQFGGWGCKCSEDGNCRFFTTMGMNWKILGMQRKILSEKGQIFDVTKNEERKALERIKDFCQPSMDVTIRPQNPLPTLNFKWAYIFDERNKILSE